MPRRRVTYNDVTVRASRLGDRIVPWQRTDRPNYEDALVDGIERWAELGDDVVIVGGGWGVTSVTAAKQVGEDGSVLTYEGSADDAANLRETLELNAVDQCTTVNHAVVGEALFLRGEQADAPVVAPQELPECDLLVLDCEGAELTILEGMDADPPAVLVETHGWRGAPEEEVRNHLDAAGYEVVDRRIAEPDLHSFCEENGIYVLTAVR